MKKVLLTSCFVALAAMAGAKTIYVSPSGSASADGSSWATAVDNLPSALALATAGDEVWMAAGTYAVTQTINVLPGVDIYGGFAGTESSIDERVRPDAENAPWQFANETVLKGSFVGRLIDHEDKTTVWEGDNAVTIDGIVVDGHDAGDNDKILFLRSNFTVRNFQLRNCFVGGKGLYFEIGGTAVDCLFSGNAQSPTTTRADIYAAQGRECMEGNRPGNTYDHCIFENNSITSLSIYNTMSNGGDVYEGETAVKNCIFRNNTASCLSVNSQWPAATGEYGNGARTLVVEDNLFEGNVASCNASGSVLHCNGTSICDFSRNIVCNNQNTAPQEGADGAFRSSKAELPVAIGYTITQTVKVFDLADAPHLLIAGATKQGKSVCLNVIVSSLLYSKHPSELKFVFIDPKRVEFTAYASLLQHYLAVLPDAGSQEEEEARAIVKQPKDAEKILRSLCTEMDERYDLLSRAGVNNLYNQKYKDRRLRPDQGHRYLPYLVVIIDEYADLTMTQGAAPESKALGRSITNSVVRLAQKGRAAGLHVILATQRPSVDVISGLIKSNFPMRIAFRTASRTDSSTILDTPGAEKLIGNGDMLFSPGLETERIQCGYISGSETETLTRSISEQRGYGRSYNTPYYLPEVSESGSDGSGSDPGSIDMHSLDSRFEEAARMVVTSQRGSTSDLQRKLGMGYARAGKVMDQLEAAGIVGPQEGSKPRQVLIGDLDSLEPILDAYLHKG